MTSDVRVNKWRNRMNFLGDFLTWFSLIFIPQELIWWSLTNFSSNILLIGRQITTHLPHRDQRSRGEQRGFPPMQTQFFHLWGTQRQRHHKILSFTRMVSIILSCLFPAVALSPNNMCFTHRFPPFYATFLWHRSRWKERLGPRVWTYCWSLCSCCCHCWSRHSNGHRLLEEVSCCLLFTAKKTSDASLFVCENCFIASSKNDTQICSFLSSFCHISYTWNDHQIMDTELPMIVVRSNLVTVIPWSIREQGKVSVHSSFSSSLSKPFEMRGNLISSPLPLLSISCHLLSSASLSSIFILLSFLPLLCPSLFPPPPTFLLPAVCFLSFDDFLSCGWWSWCPNIFPSLCLPRALKLSLSVSFYTDRDDDVPLMTDVFWLMFSLTLSHVFLFPCVIFASIPFIHSIVVSSMDHPPLVPTARCKCVLFEVFYLWYHLRTSLCTSAFVCLFVIHYLYVKLSPFS